MNAHFLGVFVLIEVLLVLRMRYLDVEEIVGCFVFSIHACWYINICVKRPLKK